MSGQQAHLQLAAQGGGWGWQRRPGAGRPAPPLPGQLPACGRGGGRHNWACALCQPLASPSVSASGPGHSRAGFLGLSPACPTQGILMPGHHRPAFLGHLQAGGDPALQRVLLGRAQPPTWPGSGHSPQEFLPHHDGRGQPGTPNSNHLCGCVFTPEISTHLSLLEAGVCDPRGLRLVTFPLCSQAGGTLPVQLALT